MEKGEYKVGLDTLFKILAVFELDMASFFDDGASPAEDDRQLWKDFLALDEDARREVRDFIRFKMSQRKGDAGE